MLILDDLHWADDATIELLDHLVRHPPRGRVLVAVAYRPAQASPRLAALVDAAGPQGVRVAVDPLSESEVREFLGPDVSHTRCRALFKASGGNPFYLEALSKMPDGAAPAGGDGIDRQSWQKGVASLTEVPPPVRAALQVELSALPPGRCGWRAAPPSPRTCSSPRSPPSPRRWSRTPRSPPWTC